MAERTPPPYEAIEREDWPTRTILVHLNVELEPDDPRSAEQIAQQVASALDSGDGRALVFDEGVRIFTPNVCIPLAEEV